jgi:hypothetical protein
MKPLVLCACPLLSPHARPYVAYPVVHLRNRGAFLEPFLGFDRQKLTIFQKHDFWLRFEGPGVGHCVRHTPCSPADSTGCVSSPSPRFSVCLSLSCCAAGSHFLYSVDYGCLGTPRIRVVCDEICSTQRLLLNCVAAN